MRDARSALPRLARHHFPHSPWRLVNEGEAEEKRRKEALPCTEAPYRGRCPGARSVAVRGRHGSGFRGEWVGGEGKCRHCTQQWKAVLPNPKEKWEDECKGGARGFAAIYKYSNNAKRSFTNSIDKVCKKEIL